MSVSNKINGVRVYKGVLHMHSTHSYDGKMSLRELKDFLLARGISFACMTEHTDQMQKEDADAFVRECRALSDDTFVFVPGFEVPYKNAHVLHIGTTVFVTNFANTAQLKLLRKQTPLVILAHPVRNKFIVDETLLSCIDGVEVWNQQYEGKAYPRTKSLTLLTKLRKEKKLIATGGLDLHRKEHFGTPMTHLEMSELSEETIVAALKNGAYAFGTEGIRIGAFDEWKPTMLARCKSRIAILIINTGKYINKALFSVGLRLPQGLTRAIRANV